MPEEPVNVRVAIQNSDESSSEADLPLMLPHDILTYLLTECQLRLDPQLVREYWEGLEARGDPFALETKDYRQARQEHQVLPAALYGDEAVIGLVNAPQAKVMGLFLSIPLWRPTSTRLSRFLLWSIECSKIVSAEATLYPVLSAICASLNKATQEGINGTFFLVNELRGDQVFMRQIWRYKSRCTATDVCYRCKASTVEGPLCYARYPSGAGDGWESTMLSTNDFVLEELNWPLCCLALFFSSLAACQFCLGWVLDALAFLGLSSLKNTSVKIHHMGDLGSKRFCVRP